MAKVSLKDVTKTYPGKSGKDAIKDLRLEIQDREFIVLVGPRNCGISSVLRMIAGLDDVSNGDIFISDRCVNEIAPKDRDIALVPQDYVLYPRLSVHDNLAFGLTRRRLPKAEIKKRMLAAAGLVGLQDLLEREPKSLSSEQRQRVAMARAIAFHPKIFLFDEVLSNLDAKAHLQIRNEIMKLHQRLQVTMIYGTHDPIEAMAIGGRVVVMNGGIVEQVGTALSLYEEPANSFVAEFVAPMNLVHGTLKKDRDSWVFIERGEGTIKVRLPICKFPGARDLAGGLVLLGVRPEDIEGVDVMHITEKYSDRFSAIVDLVEPMGREANLYLQTGGHTVVCRSQHQLDNREAGHRSQFRLNPQRVCLFDPISSHRIS